MARFKLKKQSKRQPARLRYKIEKKVRDHNKKQKRELKKNPKSKRQKPVTIPNICPFKEDILKEVDAVKKQKEEEREKKREVIKLAREEKKKNPVKLENLVNNAETRNKIHDGMKPVQAESTDIQYGENKKQENSLKAYYREFKKVIQEAEVILEVVDARDPLGTRCTQVEQTVRETNTKRLVVVLNKADLVPREILNKWLKYLRKTVPAIPFKASTQDQQHNLGRKKLTKKITDKNLKGSACVGAELLMSLLGNYCRNKGIKTSITVGIVGLPNVGKSSIINSLYRSKACNVGNTPGVTKQMQTVQLDSKIKLLDSPGIVFANNSSDTDNVVALKNAIKISSLKDPIIPATAILKRANKTLLTELYNIADFDSPQEFFAQLASRMGRFKKGGIPDQIAAARILLNDWNTGKVRYYSVPPEVESEVHVDAKIVSEIAKEFDIDSFEAMEAETLGELENQQVSSSMTPIKIDSSGPVTALAEQDDMQVDDEEQTGLISKSVNIVSKLSKKLPAQNGRKRENAEMKLDGNTSLNKIRKKQFKKEQKQRLKKEKVALSLASELENVKLTLSNDDNYDFNEHYVK